MYGMGDTSRLINGVYQQYYGDPTSGAPCDPPAAGILSQTCVNWHDDHGVPCNPLIDPNCSHAAVATQQQVAQSQAGGGFGGGLALWFTSPSAALAVIPQIANLQSMELGAIGFLPYWAGVVSPLVAAALLLGGRR